MGKLLFSYCLDEVTTDADFINVRRIDYVTRSTASCGECAAIYVGTKAGKVRRFSLRSGRDGDVERDLEPLSSARAVLHVHDPPACWGTSGFLAVGADDGSIHLFRERDLEPLFRWPVPGDEPPPAPGDNAGITSLAFLGRSEDSRNRKLLAATRDGRLLVLTPEREAFAERTIELRGWNQWLLPSKEGLTCISRQGESITLSDDVIFDRDDLNPSDWTWLGVQPTAASWVSPPPDDAGVLSQVLCLGTRHGVTFRGSYQSRQLHAPHTHSPVLCLGQSYVFDRHYLAFGLDNGRVMMVEREVLAGEMMEGEDPARRPRRFSFGFGSAVLGLELLYLRSPNQEEDACFLFVALRDHTLRLYRIEDHGNWQEKAYECWRDSRNRSTLSLDFELSFAKGSRQTMQSDSDRYLLLDAVLPVLAERDGVDSLSASQVAGAIGRLADGASPKVLQALSTRLHDYLEPEDVDSILDASMSLLRSMPRTSLRRWRAFVERHLDDLRVVISELDDDELRARVTTWMRIVRKYMLLGHTFSEKRANLDQLVEYNRSTRKFFDAFIYKSLLLQRRHVVDWQIRLDEDVSQVHLEHVSGVLVVVTEMGQLRFFDSEEGLALPVRSEREKEIVDRVGTHETLFVRPLASCVWGRQGDDRDFTLIVSWVPRRTPEPKDPWGGVTILELSRADNERYIRRQRRIDKRYEDIGLAGARIYSLACISPETSAVLAGLSTRHAPLGILKPLEDTWEMSTYPGLDVPAPAASLSRPLGQLPIRAVAVHRWHDADYLAALGADDGHIHFAEIRLSDQSAEDLVVFSPSSRFSSSVTALAVDPEAGEGHGAVFVGTSGGDVCSLLVQPEPASSGMDSSRYKIERLPIWRDVVDEPVRSMHVWRGAQYRQRPILAVSTDEGHVCFHEARLWKEGDSGSEDTNWVTESDNYPFHGIRHDRVHVMERFQTFDMSPDGSRMVSARGARVDKGRFVYLRNSPERENALRHHQELLERVTLHHQVFVGESAQNLMKRLREIAELCNVGGGALRSSLVDKRFSRDRLDKLVANSITSEMESLFRLLRPEVPEDREWIKAVLKAVATRQLRSDLPGPDRDGISQRREVDSWNRKRFREIANYIRRYTTDELATAPRAAGARGQSPVFHALFSIHLLRHLALEESDSSRPLRAEFATWIQHCLSQEERLLRVEALRAIGLTIRNVGLYLKKTPDDDRERYREALFPNGFESLAWLVDLLVSQLQRYPDPTGVDPPATAWTCLAALVQVLHLFPDRTLLIAKQLGDNSLSPDVLEILEHLVRGQRRTPARIRARLRLYRALWPSEQDARASFLQEFSDSNLTKRFRECGLPNPLRSQERSVASADGVNDDELAREIAVFCPMLYELWSATDLLDLHRRAAMIAAAGKFEVLSDGPDSNPLLLQSWLDWVKTSCTKIVELGLDKPTPFEEEEFNRLIAELRQNELPDPSRKLAEKVVAWWSSLAKPGVPRRGEYRCRRKLGDPIDAGAYGLVFKVDSEDQVEDSDTEVVKAFWPTGLAQSEVGRARKRFRRGMLVNRALHAVPGVVRVLAIDENPEFPALVLEYCNEQSLEKYLQRYFPTPEDARRPMVAHHVATKISRALHHVHSDGITHGDIHPKNVLVHNPTLSIGDPEPANLEFKLCDFDFAVERLHTGRYTTATKAYPLLEIPETWQRFLPEGGARRREIADLLQLCMLVYWILTGEKLPRDYDARTVAERARLDELARDRGWIHFAPALEKLFSPMTQERPFDSARAIYEMLVPGERLPVATANTPYLRLVLKDETIELRKRPLDDDQEVKVATARVPNAGQLQSWIEEHQKRLDPTRPDANLGHLKILGKELFRRLPTNIRDQLEELFPSHAYLRIDDENNFPWELLYFERTHELLGQLFFTVRDNEYLKSSARAESRIETVRAICFDAAQKTKLKELHRDFFVNPEVIYVQTQKHLSDAMALPHVDLLHIFGHNDPERGIVAIAGPDARGASRAQLSTGWLASAGINSVEPGRTMVIVNGCTTSRFGFGSSYDFASGFLEKGASAVITTSMPVDEDGAIAATRELFDLLSGRPMSLAAALSSLRSGKRHSAQQSYVLTASSRHVAHISNVDYD